MVSMLFRKGGSPSIYPTAHDMKSESPYHPMPQESLEVLQSLLKSSNGSDEDCATQPICAHPSCLGRRRRLLFAIFLQGFVIALTACLALSFYLRQLSTNAGPPLLYSPAQDVIEYEHQVFHEGFGKDISLYQQPPSPEVDSAWEELYNFGVSRITKEEASLLANQTYRLPGDEDHYVVHLDVFHQLHCLNMIRKALHPDYYTEGMHMDAQHLDHCVENIRQSLMCSADITPLVWQWVDRVQEVRIMGNIMHTCRNYDKIREWGVEHRLDHVLNFTGFH